MFIHLQKIQMVSSLIVYIIYNTIYLITIYVHAFTAEKSKLIIV